MSESPIFAGASIRRVRKRERLTQASMAARLGISPSYLNLIERNQRAISARVMVELIDQFEFDPMSLREDPTIGGVDGLARRLDDPQFEGLPIDREEIVEFLSASPHIAAAFARLYDAGSISSQNLQDRPEEIVRSEIERWEGHFPDLDTAAEALSDEIRLSRGDLGAALAERLRERHQLTVRILPRDVLPTLSRRLDLHARQVQLSEMLPAEDRTFELAIQIALLEFRPLIEDFASGSRFEDEKLRAAFMEHLVHYFADAIVMPYGRFLRACEATNYDFDVLQKRFGVGFDHLANRLTTLQRVGQRGLPFFAAQLDRAGRFTQIRLGASGASFLHNQPHYPAWLIHRAFERPGEHVCQSIQIDTSGSKANHWFTLAKSITGTSTACAARTTVVLGLEARLAESVQASDRVSLAPQDATKLGALCTRCEQPECLSPIG